MKTLFMWAFINFSFNCFNSVTANNCINQVFIANFMCSDIVQYKCWSCLPANLEGIMHFVNELC